MEDTLGSAMTLLHNSLIPAALLACAFVAWLDAFRKTAKPYIQKALTQFNNAVLEKCPVFYQPYKPYPFLTNCHMETIFAAKFRRCPALEYARECVYMKDGGCVSLDWDSDQDPAKVTCMVCCMACMGFVHAWHEACAKFVCACMPCFAPCMPHAVLA